MINGVKRRQRPQNFTVTCRRRACEVGRCSLGGCFGVALRLGSGDVPP